MTKSLSVFLCGFVLSTAPAWADGLLAMPEPAPAQALSANPGNSPDSSSSGERQEGNAGDRQTGKPLESFTDAAGKDKLADKADKLMSNLKSALAPKRLAAFTAGVAVGTPVAIVRQSKREIAFAARDLVGDTDNKLILASTGVLSVPAGVMSGTLYGLFFGMKDSWVNADAHPYSRDAFSLGEMK